MDPLDQRAVKSPPPWLRQWIGRVVLWRLCALDIYITKYSLATVIKDAAGILDAAWVTRGMREGERQKGDA